jgi:hypothetical protein
MGEAGLVVANASDPKATRVEIEEALLAWLDALRA